MYIIVEKAKRKKKIDIISEAFSQLICTNKLAKTIEGSSAEIWAVIYAH